MAVENEIGAGRGNVWLWIMAALVVLAMVLLWAWPSAEAPTAVNGEPTAVEETGLEVRNAVVHPGDEMAGFQNALDQETRALLEGEPAVLVADHAGLSQR